MMNIELKYSTPNMLKMVERCARVCYKSENKIKEDSCTKFVTSIIKNGHESTIEHTNLAFEIKFGSPVSYLADIQNMYFEVSEIFEMNNLIRFVTFEGLERMRYFLCGNVRMFKDLLRVHSSRKRIDNHNNSICNKITKALYKLPKEFFYDFIESGLMKDELFESPVTKLEVKPEISYENIHILNIDSNHITPNMIKHIPIEKLYKMFTCTILIKDIDRSFTHQLVRHRPVSYSQESQRYVNYDSQFNYIYPSTIDKNEIFTIPEKMSSSKLLATDQLTFNEMMEITNIFYNAIRYNNHKPEDSRAVLPNACRTEIVMTTTLDELKNAIFKMRLDSHAQYEIRLTCNRILKAIKLATDNKIFSEIEQTLEV